jgi:mRNA interferase RelE/StbE
MRAVIRPAARRDIENLDRDIASRVEKAIDALEQDPRPPGCRLLRDRASRSWRVRVGDWRILYDIDDAAGVVTILRILHRSKAY